MKYIVPINFIVALSQLVDPPQKIAVLLKNVIELLNDIALLVEHSASN